METSASATSKDDPNDDSLLDWEVNSPSTTEPFNPFQAPAHDHSGSPPYAVEIQNHKGLFWVFFSFKGRIPRRTFWGAYLSLALVFFVVAVVFSVLPEETPTISSLPILGFYIAILWCMFAVSAKRWHDLGYTGVLTLMVLIPLIGPWLHLLLLGIPRGTVGRNRFGPDPT